MTHEDVQADTGVPKSPNAEELDPFRGVDFSQLERSLRRPRTFMSMLLSGIITAMTLFALLGQAACGHADRERWQQPDLVVRKLALHPGSRVADLGAGDGYFTLRLAVATGPAGRVYAIDIAQKRLDAIAAAAHERSIGNIETVLEALTEGCYYLAVERNRYHFSLKENLNKRFADRRATIPPAQVEEQICDEIQKVFSEGSGLERVYFAEKTIQIADRPTVTGGADPGVWTSSDGLAWQRLPVTGDMPSETAMNAALLPGGVLLSDATTTWFGEAQGQ